MRTPVSLGVVGLGRRGGRIARAFDDTPLTDVRWVYEDRPVGLPRGRPRGVPAFVADFEDLLADETLDAVAVATPAATRWALARRALEADKHVFVDGVLGVGAPETADLISLAARRHRRLMIGPALLFDPGVRKLRELIELGRLGEVYYLTATFTSSEPEQVTESVLLAEAGAAVASLLYVLGDEPISASWMADSYVHPHPEIAICSLRFATGIAATLQASWLDAREQCRIAAVGSRRTAVFDAGDPRRKLTIYEKGSPRGAEIVSPRIAPGKPLHLQCEAFLAGVRAAVDEYPGTRLAPAVARVLDSAVAGSVEPPVRQMGARPALRLAASRPEHHDEASLSTQR
jgi:predicted dehydrogenase